MVLNCGVSLWGQRNLGLWLTITGRLKKAVGADTYNMNTDFNVLHCVDTGNCPVPWWAGSGHQSGRKLLQGEKTWKLSADLLPWSGSSRVIWAWELALGTRGDRIARDWLGLWQLDWLKLSQNCELDNHRGSEPHGCGWRSFPVPAVLAAGPQPRPPTKRCYCPRSASRAAPFSHRQPGHLLLQELSKPNYWGLRGRSASRQGTGTSRGGRRQEVWWAGYTGYLQQVLLWS